MKNLERFVGVIVIGAVITAGVFAQETSEGAAEQAGSVEQAASAGQNGGDGAQTAVSVDLSPLVKGIIWTDNDKDYSLFALAPSFERLVRPHYTVGAAADLYFGEAGKNADGAISISYFGLAVHGRYYPQSAGMEKFFIDAGLGFNVFSLDGESDAKKGGFTGLALSLKAGYKLMLTPGFFFEPSMAFVYAKTPANVSVPTPLGWQPGLGIGGAF
ncbi:MAG: autotransporter outer membrane beta-barrel domain-containing protein [Spirochaetaceae bacterium]|jgi:hypothetical protein|nr:autotransporter outer membrane beta-barrel domain-containing protein [Spirochaetaceae bacterium]